MRDETTGFEWNSKCVTARYEDKGDGTVSVRNGGRAWWWWFTYYYTADGLAIFNKNGKGAEAAVNLNPLAPTKADTEAIENSNYNVLYTDYDTYSVVYSCAETWLGGAIYENLWILSRTTTLP